MVDLCTEFLYVWVGGGRGVESVSFNHESFGDFSEVRYHVRDVTFEEFGVLRWCLRFCGIQAHLQSTREDYGR